MHESEHSTSLAVRGSWLERIRTRPYDIHRGDRRFQQGVRILSIFVGLILVGIFLQLGRLSLPSLQASGARFLISTDWDPVSEVFGSAALAYGTLVSSLIALLISVPVSLGVALFLTELAPRTIAAGIGFLVEMLAAIPSVVYGLWGIFVLVPFMRGELGPILRKSLGFLPFFQGPAYGVGMLTAGLILAIMITPTIASLAREVFRAVPLTQREAVLALGGTRWESISLGVLKSARPGILGAVVLGLGRALGETMAVTMVIGNRAEISLSLFAPAQTMASAIANEYAEATSDLHLAALAEAGLVLFLISLTLNWAARALISRADRELHGGSGRK